MSTALLAAVAAVGQCRGGKDEEARARIEVARLARAEGGGMGGQDLRPPRVGGIEPVGVGLIEGAVGEGCHRRQCGNVRPPMEACRTCALLARRDAGEAPLWDSIVRTPSWDVVHCDNTSLTGWIVLVARRHVASVAELDEDEAMALGLLIRNVSRALLDILDCEKTYVVQFAEHPQHRHVHVHVIPRAHDLPDDQRGPGVFGRLGVPDAERVGEAEMNELAHHLRRRLSSEVERGDDVVG